MPKVIIWIAGILVFVLFFIIGLNKKRGWK